MNIMKIKIENLVVKYVMKNIIKIKKVIVNHMI